MRERIDPKHTRYEPRYRAVYDAGVPFATGDREDQRLACFRRFLEQQVNPGRLIDLGCGEGFPALIAAEKGYEVLGVDSAPSAIAKCQETHHHPRLTFVQADVCELSSIPSESFDVAVDLGCLHMLVEDDDARRCIGHAFRVLRPGGLWYGQNLVPADDAEAWCPHERERVEWWRKRIAEPDDGTLITESFEVNGRTVEVCRPRTPAATDRTLHQQVALLTGTGFRVDSARVVSPGVNSPFEAVVVARKLS